MTEEEREKACRQFEAVLEGKSLCPNCHEPLEYLTAVIEAGKTYDIANFDGDNYDVFDSQTEPTEPKYEFSCPECGEVLADDEDEARRLLGGKG